MIQIRDVLQVKFGSIDQAVDLFSQLSTPDSNQIMLGEQFEVLTDITGDMYTLVNEFVAGSLDQFAEMREKQFAQPEFDAWFKQFQLYVEGGRREYYTVEGKYNTWSRPGVIVVRECYQAYQWQIHRAVSLLERYGGLMAAYGVGSNPRILTDMSGPMFQAIIEIETESMSAWESRRRAFFREVEFQVWFNQMLTTVETGSHDFFRVEYTGG